MANILKTEPLQQKKNRILKTQTTASKQHAFIPKAL